jgi:anthranilate phosphoribosyltransferase
LRCLFQKRRAVSDELLIQAARFCREKNSLDLRGVPALADALLDPAVPGEAKADFLRALADKGETAEELAAFAQAILPHATDPGFSETWNGQLLLDCCGTGGGGLNIINVSTAIVFVLAAGGVPVVKHGNRGVTKKSGSADVLESLGIAIELAPEQVRECLNEVGCAFLFAPRFHPAFKTLAPVRRMLADEGRRTIFNLLGPLLNPCRPGAQLVGVFSEAHADLFAEALHFLGRKRYTAVCGFDDTGRPTGEFSPFGRNIVRGNVVFNQVVSGDMPPLSVLAVASAQESAHRIQLVFSGEDTGPAREIIRSNAGAAFHVQGRTPDLVQGLQLADEIIAGGRAQDVLEKWRAFSKKQN